MLNQFLALQWRWGLHAQVNLPEAVVQIQEVVVVLVLQIRGMRALQVRQWLVLLVVMLVHRARIWLREFLQQVQQRTSLVQRQNRFQLWLVLLVVGKISRVGQSVVVNVVWVQRPLRRQDRLVRAVNVLDQFPLFKILETGVEVVILCR